MRGELCHITMRRSVRPRTRTATQRPGPFAGGGLVPGGRRASVSEPFWGLQCARRVCAIEMPKPALVPAASSRVPVGRISKVGPAPAHTGPPCRAGDGPPRANRFGGLRCARRVCAFEMPKPALVPAASSRVPVGRISKVAQNAQGKSPAQTFTLLKFENGRALGGSVATSGWQYCTRVATDSYQPPRVMYG